MAQSGVNYFLSNYSTIFNYQDFWKVNFDFKKRNVIMQNTSGASPLYSGVCNFRSNMLSGVVLNTYDYFRVYGRNDYVSITPSTGLWSNDFSLLFLNINNVSSFFDTASIIFSCLESGDYNGQNVYKGYTIGYNSVGNLFFSYYGKNGQEIFTTDFILNQDQSIYCIKNEDNLTLGSYDFLKQETKSNSFFIDSNYLFEPSKFCLGYYTGNVNLDNLITNNGGTLRYSIDEFLYFTTALYDYDIQIINSGWIANYVPAYTGSGNILTTGITGYSTGQILLGSGITGIGITGTGFLTNQYGVSYTGYLTGQLTGNIYGSGAIPLTGSINTPVLQYIDESVVVNTGFVKSFFNSSLTYLKKIDKSDYTSLLAETGHIDWLGYNNIASFDSTKDKFKIFQQEPLTCWLNGIQIFSGQLITTGSVYNPILILENDYYRTGNYLESTGFYNRSDQLDYLSTTSVNYYNKNFSYTGGNVLTITGAYSGTNTLVSFNGQLLYSGTTGNGGNYVISGNDIVFNQNLYDGNSGTLAIINLDGQFNNNIQNNAYITQSFNNVFNPYYSLVFLNGQKQTPDVDFLFLDANQLLLKSGVFEYKEDNLFNNFNNNDLFFNII